MVRCLIAEQSVVRALVKGLVRHCKRAEHQGLRHLPHLVRQEQQGRILAQLPAARRINLVSKNRTAVDEVEDNSVSAVPAVEDSQDAGWERFGLAAISEVLMNLCDVGFASDHHRHAILLELWPRLLVHLTKR